MIQETVPFLRLDTHNSAEEISFRHKFTLAKLFYSVFPQFLPQVTSNNETVFGQCLRIFPFPQGCKFIKIMEGKPLQNIQCFSKKFLNAEKLRGLSIFGFSQWSMYSLLPIENKPILKVLSF